MELPNIVLKEARVLVVDDAALSRAMLRNILYEIGFRKIEDAPDALSGLKKLEESLEKGDAHIFLFCDWMMPGLDGIELIKKIKSNPKFEKLKIIMVSSEGETENILKAIEAGANTFMTKPISKEAVYKKLQGILGHK